MGCDRTIWAIVPAIEKTVKAVQDLKKLHDGSRDCVRASSSSRGERDRRGSRDDPACAACDRGLGGCADADDVRGHRQSPCEGRRARRRGEGLGVQIAALQSLIDWIATGTDGEASQAAIRTTTERKSEAEALLVRLERARDRLAAAADVCDAAQSNTDRHW